MKRLKTFEQFSTNEETFNAFFRPDQELIDKLKEHYPAEMDEIIYAMLSKEPEKAMQFINDFVKGLGVKKGRNKEGKEFMFVDINPPIFCIDGVYSMA